MISTLPRARSVHEWRAVQREELEARTDGLRRGGVRRCVPTVERPARRARAIRPVGGLRHVGRGKLPGDVAVALQGRVRGQADGRRGGGGRGRVLARVRPPYGPRRAGERRPVARRSQGTQSDLRGRLPDRAQQRDPPTSQRTERAAPAEGGQLSHGTRIIGSPGHQIRIADHQITRSPDQIS